MCLGLLVSILPCVYSQFGISQNESPWYCWISSESPDAYTAWSGYTQYLWTFTSFIISMISFISVIYRVISYLGAAPAQSSGDVNDATDEKPSTRCCTCHETQKLYIRIFVTLCGLYFTYLPDFIGWTCLNLYSKSSPAGFNTMTAALWRFEGTIFSLIWISNSNTAKCFMEVWQILVNGRNYQEDERNRSKSERDNASRKSSVNESVTDDMSTAHSESGQETQAPEQSVRTTSLFKSKPSFSKSRSITSSRMSASTPHAPSRPSVVALHVPDVAINVPDVAINLPDNVELAKQPGAQAN
jgi:hypothetical protein